MFKESFLFCREGENFLVVVQRKIGERREKLRQPIRPATSRDLKQVYCVRF